MDTDEPLSTNNVFHWRTGEPTVFMKDPAFNRYAKTGQIATEAVEKMRADNRDNSTLYGMSAKADALVYQFKINNFNVHIASREESDRTISIRHS